MGEYEPHDSRNVTLRQNRAPGEPPRTGPMEGETRAPRQQQAGRTELEEDERGEDAEQTVESDAALDELRTEQAQREAAMERDADELDAAEDAARHDRND